MYKAFLIALIGVAAQAIRLEDEAAVEEVEEDDFDVDYGMDLAADATKKVAALTDCFIEWKKLDTAWRQHLHHERTEQTQEAVEAAYLKILDCVQMQYGYE